MRNKIFLACLCFFLLVSQTSAGASCPSFDDGCVAREMISEGGVKKSTTWRGRLHAFVRGEFKVYKLDVTLKPTTSTTGTWTSFPFAVFDPYSQLAFPNALPTEEIYPFTVKGRWSGEYRIVGSTIYVSSIVNPEGTTIPNGQAADLSVTNASLQIKSLGYISTLLRRIK